MWGGHVSRRFLTEIKKVVNGTGDHERGQGSLGGGGLQALSRATRWGATKRRWKAMGNTPPASVQGVGSHFTCGLI